MMPKLESLRGSRLVPLLCILLGSFSQSSVADVQINLGAGYLKTNTGGQLPAYTSPTNTGPGGLLMFVAANPTTNTFTNALSAGQYVSGGDITLAAFSFNNFGGNATNQTTQNSVSFTLPSSVAGGTTLIELRWFPNITLTQYGNNVTPAAGSYFGAYNPSLYPSVNGTNLATDGGSSWVVPANGARSYALNFFTQNNTEITGSQPFMEGYANFMVTPVPEPSTGLVAGLALVIAFGTKQVWKRSRSSVL